MTSNRSLTRLATPLVARELAVIGGAGGAVGVAGQGVADVMRGEIGTPGDYLGAGIGGSVGALTSLYGRAGYAGAAGGGATSVAQDVLNGRVKSVREGIQAIDRARDPALAGGAFAVVPGMAGRAWADDLSRKEKEMLGENFSGIRTRIRGDSTATRTKSREYLPSGDYTYPDQRTVGGRLIESKGGRYAELSPNQRQAFLNLDNYRVDHILPRDVGAVWAILWERSDINSPSILGRGNLGWRILRPLNRALP